MSNFITAGGDWRKKYRQIVILPAYSVFFAMPVHGEPLLEAVKIIFEKEETQKTLVSSCTTGAGTTASALVGSLLLGPLGVVIGAGIGAAAIYAVMKNKYKPIFAILKEDLSPQQQEELKTLLYEAFKDFGMTDVMKIAASIMDNRELKDRLMDMVRIYLIKEGLMILPRGEGNSKA